ncbi:MULTISPECIES: hypothetical protein [Planococcus]|uniref:Uncharacterized protein n=2 Tax=Planococcus TaxID=1372 RepID=A0A0U2Z7T2_9BACL|nr:MULTISPECIES: hypothetical protein [Planococcus]ALS75899.1 hypothetical protein AUC31_12145 [Planococcus rifietoensis]AUD14991.1 hypothetical protein CW734_16600 [Planococcus sp. MB-3u-03]PKG47070.1 hypothetical protein CXF66_04520 [Planococcus sp. Urea-trap-24]PKG87801.1 hypothetical protein CXF91_17690 [Planococcus sp. Urea-3u-39]PKH35459.1 hypothetical protein CXF77_17370 [Planococcus sp. MB-3u-09]
MNEELLIADEVQRTLKARCEYREGKFHFTKTKKLDIFLGSSLFVFKLDMEISFGHFQQDGAAVNKARVYILPEEMLAFEDTLRKFPIPLPIAFRQCIHMNQNLVEITMESLEPPRNFALRLAAALKEIEP